jgi:hypothetical protein
VILFLDFDGVTHPEPCYTEDYFALAPLVEKVVRDFPGTRVVISSAWRENHSLGEIRAMLPMALASMVEGITPSSLPSSSDHICIIVPEEFAPALIPYARHREIAYWLNMYAKPWDEWVALDDRAYLFKPFLPNLIKCDMDWGMTEHDADILRHKLAHGGLSEMPAKQRLLP